MAKKRRHLGEILYKAGLVKKEALIEAIKASKSNHKRLGEILLDKGLIDEENLTKALIKELRKFTKVHLKDNLKRLYKEQP